MTRSKLGRRVSALLLFVLLLSASVLPAFATSTSGQLQEVGWAETVSSFLMASGIYPFESDPETGYEEWSVSSLKALWDEFRDDTTQVAYDIVDLTGNLVKGVIAIASGRWSVLREFATWIVNKYSVTDNQTGLEAGKYSPGFLRLPLVSSGASNTLSSGLLFATEAGIGYYVALNNQNVGGLAYCAYYGPVRFQSSDGTSFYGYQLFPVSRGSGRIQFATTNGNSSSHSLTLGNYDVYSVPNFLSTTNPIFTDSSVFSSDIPSFATPAELLSAFANTENPEQGEFQGITADTTTVSIPAALPEGTDFGGLAVSGTGVAATPEQLEEIVQNAVKEALKPSVAVVPVALSPDVNVNPSGEITLSGDVTIDTGNIPLQPSDYSAPNLTQVFPFSIPWDMLAVLNALDAEPVRPEFNVDLYIPVLDVHVPWTIGVSEALQEPVDAFMASVRLMLLVAMCVATLWAFWRSNL